MIQKQLVKKRFPNWLPIPNSLKIVPKEVVVSENDFFPKGEIVKFFQGQDYGFIKDQHGRDVYFHLSELDLIGPKGSKEFVKVGSKVGYDLSWTSKGEHVRRLKIY